MWLNKTEYCDNYEAEIAFFDGNLKIQYSASTIKELADKTMNLRKEISKVLFNK
jgi:hypothetical protein